MMAHFLLSRSPKELEESCDSPPSQSYKLCHQSKIKTLFLAPHFTPTNTKSSILFPRIWKPTQFLHILSCKSSFTSRKMVRILPMASSIRPSLSSLKFSGSSRLSVSLLSHNSTRKFTFCHLGTGKFSIFFHFQFSILNPFSFLYFSFERMTNFLCTHFVFSCFSAKYWIPVYFFQFMINFLCTHFVFFCSI